MNELDLVKEEKIWLYEWKLGVVVIGREGSDGVEEEEEEKEVVVVM
jgi:hypothetical protein